MACGELKLMKNWRVDPTKKYNKIKSQRLKWLGHVERMPKERKVTRIYKWKPLFSRPIGRPKNKLEGDVRKDLQTMKVKNWKNNVLNRDLWKTGVSGPKLT
jgi:hypothetical protein